MASRTGTSNASGSVSMTLFVMPALCIASTVSAGDRFGLSSVNNLLRMYVRGVSATKRSLLRRVRSLMRIAS